MTSLSVPDRYAKASRMEFIDLRAQADRLRDEIDVAFAKVVEHGRFILGPEVSAFESELASRTGAAHVVTCGNGTDALVLALRALGVEPGDSVVVPSFTFAATAEAVALVGGVPVFADVEPDTFNLDIESALAAVDAYGCVGVIPVDLFGLPFDCERLAGQLRQDRFVLADAAQAIGGTLGGAAVGTLARVTTTSFFPAKPLGCYGDGGAVLTEDEDIADVIRSLRFHGKGATKYDNERIGMNSRLDTLQAAVLRCKLAILDDEIERRQHVADRYSRALEQVVTAPSVPEGRRSAWAQYTIVTDARDELAAALDNAGIPTAIYYPRPLHVQTAYHDFPVGPTGCRVSEQLSERVLSLPMHPYLRSDDQQRVIDAVLGFFE